MTKVITMDYIEYIGGQKIDRKCYPFQPILTLDVPSNASKEYPEMAIVNNSFRTD